MWKSAALTTVASISLLLASACTGGSAEESAEDFPNRGLTLIAASDPGGGLDLASRAVEEALKAEALLDVDLQVESIGGGGGNPARAALLERAHDGYTVVAESNRVFLNPLTGTTDMEHTDFVPISKLMTEYLVWAVKADSDWESAEDILEAVREDPKAVHFGIATSPSNDLFNVMRPLQEAGVDVAQVEVTTFSGGGDLLTNLLGGRVDVVSTGVGELAGLQGEEVRIIAHSAPEPQGGALSGVPTWRELGLDFELDHWRGVFGPADMPPEAVEWWSSIIEKMSSTPTWLDRLEQNGWTPDYEDSNTFAQTVETHYELASRVIADLGLGG